MNYDDLTNAVKGITTRDEANTLAGEFGKVLGERLKALEVNPHPIVNKFQSNVRSGIGVSTWNKYGPNAKARGTKAAGMAGTTTSRGANVGRTPARARKKTAGRTSGASRARSR